MAFDASRLHPNKSNVRTADGEARPTPKYNADIASDGMTMPTQQLSEETASPAFSQAVILLKVWSRQRGHGELAGMANISFIHTLLVTYLLSGAVAHLRQVSVGSSAWQVFRAVLSVLGRSYVGSGQPN